MKRNIYGIISVLLLALALSFVFTGCITPPGGPRRDNRRRRHERQEQPGRNSYEQPEEECTVIDGVSYSK
jgi:hypothetical protein